MSTTPIDRSPVRLGSGTAIALALVAWFAVGIYAVPAFVAGVPGVALLVIGTTRGTHWPVTLGAVLLFASALLAGVWGAPALALLVGTAMSVLAWDTAGTAIDLGEQLGREAATVRVQAAHIGASALVGLVTIGISYGIYRSVAGGQPLAALVFLLLAALLLTEALRE